MTQITKSEMKSEGELLILWNKKHYKKYYEQLHTLDNLDKMDKFLERHKLLKMT